MHLDAGSGWVPTSTVAEVVGVEVGAEVAVETCEDVEVEGGGGSGCVVVGSEKHGFGLVGVGATVRGEIRAEKQSIAGEELGAEVAEDVSCVFGGEVADAGADVEGQGAGVGEAVERQGFAGVVGYLDADGDAGDVAEDVVGGFGERGLGDVDGLVHDASLLADSFGRGGYRSWSRFPRRVR